MQTEKQQVYHCRGIVKQLNAYIKADKLLILCESDVPAEIKKDITAQFPEAACYTVPGTAHIKTFDNLEAIVRFLYQSGCQKESSLLIIGNQQLKELGGFIASAYCCGIAYLYVPLTGNAALHAASHFCGVDLMGIPDV